MNAARVATRYNGYSMPRLLFSTASQCLQKRGNIFMRSKEYINISIFR